jgi:hypothetical protein
MVVEVVGVVVVVVVAGGGGLTGVRPRALVKNPAI